VTKPFEEESTMDEPTATTEQPEASADEQLTEDVLVEEVSIDGMCGVY
jgi:mycofactocin precursor